MTMNKISTHLAEMSGLDLDTCLQIIQLFKVQSLQLMDDLYTYMKDLNSTEVSSLLHKLKGSSGNVCATEIAKMAALAELANNQKDYEGLAKWIDAIDQAINSM